MNLPALVVDSWPILEWLKLKPGVVTSVDALFEEAKESSASLHMSRINCGEVIYSIRKAKDISDKALALALFRSAPIRVHSVDDALVDAAVDLKSGYPLAYADAFAAALAIRLHAPLVTGDVEFLNLQADGLLTLHWLGE